MNGRVQQILALTILLAMAGCGGGDVDRLVAELQSDDTATRRIAARDLGALHPTEPAAIAALEAATRDRDREVRRLCCVALGDVGSGQEALTAAIDDAELSVRLAASFGLLKLEPDSRPAIAVLTSAMKLGDGGVIVAVSQQGPPAQWAIPTFIELTKDKRPGIRRLAVDALGKVGVASPEVISALQSAQRDADDRVRESVAAAIDRINGV